MKNKSEMSPEQMERLRREEKRLVPYSSVLLHWYEAHWRALPWRADAHPYRVWVSEIMLQQTRIEAVLPYFERFMESLPTLQDLANADEQLLLKLWEGLGYYSRVRNLQRAARQVVELYGGELPADYEALRGLPGIGDYTAGAVASISFGLPVPAVDGNVMRVLARLTADDQDILRPAAKRWFQQLATAVLPPDQPGAFNQALMELGETVCLPNTEPLCDRCPMAPICTAREQGVARQLPVRSPKKARRVEQRTVLVLIAQEEPGRVLLHKRPDRGLLAGLWELPNTEGWLTTEQAISWAEERGFSPDGVRALPPGKHLFSHIEWQMQGYEIRGTRQTSVQHGVKTAWVTVEDLRREYALPSAFRTYSAGLPAALSGPIQLTWG